MTTEPSGNGVVPGETQKPTIDVDFTFACDPPLPKPLTVDLRKLLGVRPLRRDANGLYFEWPEPFADLRVYSGETLRDAKRQRLAVAIEYFDAVGPRN